MTDAPEPSAQRAVARGVDRLVRLAGPAGWHGFRTLAGESDVWVTAFVLARIAPLAPQRAAVRRARAALAATQGAGGGWGFGTHVPPDADSTAWALQALDGTRLLSRRRRELAGTFLADQRSGDGYATFREDGGIAAFIEAGGRSLAGWTAEHADVTAAVLGAGPPGTSEREALEQLVALVERQTGAGWWSAYWWRAPQYTTALVLRALARHGRALPPVREQRLLNALAREALPGGGYALGAATEPDAFATALALEVLAELTAPEARELGTTTARALVSAQQPDGGWQGDFSLRIPPPDEPEPALVRRWARGGGGGGSYALDRDGLFATAQACAALAAWGTTTDRPPRERPPSLPRRAPHEDEHVVEVLAEPTATA